jgi:two-component system response regulator PilR (NtrC family)
MEAEMEFIAVADRIDETELAVHDEEMVARCAATTLITGSLASEVERLARRIHASGPRAALPFVQVSGRAFPADPAALSEAFATLIDAAAGGTLLVTDVEEMPAIVQDRFIDTLVQLPDGRDPLAAVRLVVGTTVSLRQRIADGTFSDRLFSRVNINHVVVKGAVLLRETTRRMELLA